MSESKSVTYVEKSEKKKQIEVRFPLFRKHDCGSEDYEAMHNSLTQNRK